MPNYRRLFVPGGQYFFTVNLRVRDTRLLVECIDDFRAAYRDTARKYPFGTLAICVLPNHLHCVWQLPRDDDDFPTRWRHLKSGFSRRIPKCDDLAEGRRKGERGIWQRRYWEHAIRDDEDLAAHIEYVHFNPVKHRLVEDVDDWPYSSWHQWRKDNAEAL